MRTPGNHPGQLFTPPGSTAPAEPTSGDWTPETAPFQLMNIVPNPQKPHERWSDAPGFQGARLEPGPDVVNKAGRVMQTQQMQFLLDPEKHIERTSAYPDTGPPNGYGRGGVGGSYGGSTDAKPFGSSYNRPTSEVWEDKKSESQMSHGEAHGGGLVRSLQSGESIRHPVHLIIDPSEPQWGRGDIEDRGGFGHHQPVQWEGHHRVAAAAVEQERRRESGQKDWGVPVPYDMHFGTSNAISALVRNPKRFRPDPLASQAEPLPKRKIGGGYGTGTWNSSAY